MLVGIDSDRGTAVCMFCGDDEPSLMVDAAPAQVDDLMARLVLAMGEWIKENGLGTACRTQRIRCAVLDLKNGGSDAG